MEELGPYQTPADLPTKADVDKDMERHVFQAHTLSHEMEKTAVQRLEMEARKMEAEAALLIARTREAEVQSSSDRNDRNGAGGGSKGEKEPPFQDLR